MTATTALPILALLLAGVAVLLLLVTAESWLVALLTRLDRVLTRLRFGSWTAGLLTKLEERAAERRRRGRTPPP